MRSAVKADKDNSKKNYSIYRNAFALILFGAVLFSALLSWSSSRTLSFFLDGTWHSANGDALSIACEGNSVWSSACRLKSPQVQFDGVVDAAPLTSGGWVASVKPNPSGLSVMWHQGKTLTLLTEQKNGVTTRFIYTRDQAVAKDFVSAVRMKGKYIVALFLIVGTYKWVQVSMFGAPVRRVRRF